MEHVLHYARLIMEADPFKERAPKEEDHSYRALFGISPQITLLAWQLLEKHDLIPEGGLLTHFLWTLMYSKNYPKWKTMRQLTRTDPKTLRKWIGVFRENFELLLPHVVSRLVASS